MDDVRESSSPCSYAGGIGRTRASRGRAIGLEVWLASGTAMLPPENRQPSLDPLDSEMPMRRHEDGWAYG